ncbi:RsmE family RNA methyltransferase [Marinigracilibium pacificum]|uniref:Ribosomal RNA small subunit methyltransferase E n=1 Tax=Marinigracilibium pacificum TaxID=2729599 RepID=A0A848J0G5_9BACT|nr:RsmE family RNA methyltransferase [Marinigracilibium pacificum]NMM50047.1 16S rRNA (uracil(1498)-N(3))-methyltransferase [Marinigracilibium pacificum]
MQLFFHRDIKTDKMLPESEAVHCTKVLRKSVGDEINVIDGQGYLYTCVITNTSKKTCEVEIKHEEYFENNLPHINLLIAPTKNAERIEWFAEKAVETGVSQITIILTDNTERKKFNMDRLEKKIVSASKQARRFHIPTLVGPEKLENIFNISVNKNQQNFICYVEEHQPDHLYNKIEVGSDINILIGPEGDFSKEEYNLAIKSGYIPVSLGDFRLRTETAGLAAIQMAVLKNSI